MEHIHLASLLKLPAIVDLLPLKLQPIENVPVVTYRLTNTIRHKILNRKEFVDSIIVDDEVSFTQNSDNCRCSDSPFCDPHHHHIITSDLRIIENGKLRKLLAKGPNYREPRTINYNKYLIAIESGLTDCIERLVEKTNVKKKTLLIGEIVSSLNLKRKLENSRLK